ncbi:hypothetical protein TSTA_010060 [Talaromyces stipitatus ATCC 10500]|uniref:Uncharacterized protein n=1 Tax=Talaromyces stipitatus (strain ATCC 10500 / CBS 375.48 / QM 6759 / NRRL 1006) TaxID=441959 RepID=B8MG21_TALSN|nr:uncharacterized protein TSTA_010060 [Talaromyces stipitatus ATCC 10500]EED15888.1 hypothetical protein TSTA_010060 [Talaromyces stipitatus ATCC 10500]
MKSELRKAKVSADGAHRIQEITKQAEAEGETEILNMILGDIVDLSELRFADHHTNTMGTRDNHEAQTESVGGDAPTVGPQLESFPSQPIHILRPQPQQDQDIDREPINNPLALLADASGAAQKLCRKGMTSTLSPASHADSSTSNGTISSSGSALARYISLVLRLNRASLEQGLEALFTDPSESDYRRLDYFKPPNTETPRDVGSDIGPVDLGLVTMDEACYLFPM